MSDFAPILNAIFSGGLEGMQLADKNNLVQAKAKLDAAKAARDNSKTDVEMADKGFKLNPTTKQYEIDPDFYTPPTQGATPDAISKISQARAAAAAGGADTSGIDASMAQVPAAQPGNPSYLRAQRVAELAAAKNPKYMANPPSLRTAWQLANPGVPVPAHLQGELGDQPYHQDLGPLLTRKPMNPNDTMADDAATAALEKSEGLPPGALKGITKGKVASGGAFIAGNQAKSAAEDKKFDFVGGENQKKRDADAANLQKRLDAAKQIAAGKGPGAKEYEAYISKDRAAAVGVINDLKEAQQQLIDRGDGSWQSYFPGAVPIFDKELEAIKTNIENAAASGLKERFGGRPSNMEMQNQLRFSYNTHLTESQNAEIIGKRISAAQAIIDSKDAWVRNRQKRGGGSDADLEGFSQDTSDLPPAGTGEEPLNPSAVRAKAAKTGGAAVNGNVIPKKTLDAIRKFPIPAGQKDASRLSFEEWKKAGKPKGGG